MNVKQIREINLRALLQGRSIGELAGTVSTDPNYLSQILSPKRAESVGHKLARKLEAAFGKPDGWMDQLHVTQDAAGAIDEGILAECLRQLQGHNLTPDQMAKIIAANYSDALAGEKLNLAPSIRIVSSR